MRKWQWWKNQDDTVAQERAAQAQQAYMESEGEIQSALMQAGEARVIAESLRNLRASNHFALRMKTGIQEGLHD